MKEVFISHSSKDKDVATSVCSFLEEQDISCWVSHRDIPAGMAWVSAIIGGIKETNIVVVLISKYSNESENVLNEIDQAVSFKKTIIPFRLDDTEINEELKWFLNSKQWIDASTDFEEGLQLLSTTCKNQFGKTKTKDTSTIIRPHWAPFVSEEQKNALQDIFDDMTEIEGGLFRMGATQEQEHDAYEWEKPIHNVILSNYYITKHLITQEIWSNVMTYNPSLNKNGKNLPVETISWEECQDFVKALAEMTGLDFKLPTEAQWEYAARGGGRIRGKKYSGGDCIDDYAWYDKNSNGKTHPVGKKNPNELGLYDMSGNVWEWCSDWYDVYDPQVTSNPMGAASGTRKVLRGGSANNSDRCCRISYRIGRNPKYKDGFWGFRLVI